MTGEGRLDGNDDGKRGVKWTLTRIGMLLHLSGVVRLLIISEAKRRLRNGRITFVKRAEFEIFHVIHRAELGEFLKMAQLWLDS